MEPIKNFAIFKVANKKNEKSPDYTLSAKVGEEYVDIGAGWVKDGAKGKFISCVLSNPYVDHVKQTNRKGFHLMADNETSIAKSYTPDKADPGVTLDDVVF